MISNGNFRNFIFLIILFTIVEQDCEAIANHAIYTIENLGSRQCLSAGGVVKNSNNSNVTLYKHGRVKSKPCTDINSINTTDFSQQWMVRIHRENPRNSIYEIQLAMLNTLYYDAKLIAELRGEFIMYFPDKVNLRAQHPVDENTQSQEFVIVNPTNNNCLSDRAEGMGIQFVKCNSSAFQQWNFTLVNEKLIMQDTLDMPTSPTPLH